MERGLHLSRARLDELLRVLRARDLKIGFAESCTGGLLSGSFARVPGVSDVFLGSVVSYSNQVKIDLLGVSPTTLRFDGAVSERVAREMARGACEHLHVECSIAVTGIAGPSGGTPEKPVGTVWFAVRGPAFEAAVRRQFSGDRDAIQNQAVEFATEFLLGELLKK